MVQKTRTSSSPWPLRRSTNGPQVISFGWKVRLFLGCTVLVIVNFHILGGGGTSPFFDDSATSHMVDDTARARQIRTIKRQQMQDDDHVASPDEPLVVKAISKPDDDDQTFLDQITKTLMDSFLLNATAAAQQKRGSLMISSLHLPAGGDDSQPHQQPSACECDLISTDCLDFIPCLPAVQDNHHHHNHHHHHHNNNQPNNSQRALQYLALELQRALQQTAELNGPVPGDNPLNPIGKQHQYNTIDAWNDWVEEHRLPKYYYRHRTNVFVNASWYPSCVEHNRTGKNCWFDKLSANVHATNTGNTLELKARSWFATLYPAANVRRAVQRRVEGTFQTFLTTQQTHLQQRRQEDRYNNYKKKTKLSPMGHLMIFAHMSRLLFHRRPLLEQLYQQHVTTIVPTTTKQQHAPPPLTTGEPFAIAIHMRRGDSCSIRDEETDEIMYDADASPLDSPAQITSVRRCYQTRVYLHAISRIQKYLAMTTNNNHRRPLHVYISTDDPADVMNDIQTNHTHIFEQVDAWHFLNYSRDHFQYGDLSIEDDENSKRPILGETAVSDLWLLSHGQAFVGHLGSRFGKVAWLLATSRHGSFVPFLSVDGHSFCCEIDEPCGKMRQYITDMENCMTFSHELEGIHETKKAKTMYWTHGSSARKTLYYQRKKEQEKEPEKE